VGDFKLFYRNKLSQQSTTINTMSTTSTSDATSTESADRKQIFNEFMNFHTNQTTLILQLLQVNKTINID
jgi:hypothetical protein